jgi:hypothetical protein
MASPSTKIRDLIDAHMSAEPTTMALMVALVNHHGGGGVEWGSKANSQSRHEDGEVRSEPELLKALSGPIRKLLQEMEIDPKVSNPCMVAFRVKEGIAVSLLVVSPGDVEKGQWASYQSCTEKEWFDIANGPKPERYPYAKMPHPTGTVVEILADGSLSEPSRTVPPTGEWFYCPIEWSAIAGLPSDVLVPDPLPNDAEEREKRDSGLRSDGKDVDPFISDVLTAIQMQPPGIRDIRRIGVPNGFRDKRGNVIE